MGTDVVDIGIVLGDDVGDDKGLKLTEGIAEVPDDGETEGEAVGTSDVESNEIINQVVN